MRLAVTLSLVLMCLPTFGSTLVFYNAHLHLQGSSEATDTWLAVSDGKVKATGQGKTYQKLKADRLENLNGRHVFPGLTDSHVHLAEIGAETFEVDLRAAHSADEAVSRVRTFLQGPGSTTTGAILGVGWDQSEWPGQKFPTRAELDALSTTRPIVLNRIDGHAAWVNTFVLKGAELFDKPTQPEGGKIVLDDKGVPTGILIDTAMDELEDVVDDISDAETEIHYKIAVEKALSLGITGAHEAGASPEQIEVIRKMLHSGTVRFRFNEMVLTDEEDEIQKLLNKGIEVGAENGQLTVRSVKLFADGAMGSRGAAFDKPYTDDPGNLGLLRMSPTEMEKQIRRFDAKGFQVAVHAIGDRANREVIDAFEKVMGAALAVKRPRLEHAQILSPSDVIRVGKLGVIASMQPVHVISDMKWVVDRIGKERAQTAYAWASLKKAGARLAFGSDSPVDDLNPWHGLFAAIRRQNTEHEPKGGFVPKEKLTLKEAFHAYTSGAAFAGFAEDTQGELTVGHYADFIVLPRDPLHLSSRDLFAMTVDATYVGGQKAWPLDLPKKASQGARRGKRRRA